MSLRYGITMSFFYFSKNTYVGLQGEGLASNGRNTVDGCLRKIDDVTIRDRKRKEDVKVEFNIENTLCAKN